MSPGFLAVIVVASFVLLTGIILFIVFASMRRAIKRSLALVESEGIVLDSGKIHLTYRLRGFRAPGIRVGTEVRSGPGRLVLTRRRLCTIPISWRLASVSDIALADLTRFQVGRGEGGILFRTNDPPNARGSVEIVASVSDVEAWVKALVSAGAHPLSA